jgi:hypothetical protein
MMFAGRLVIAAAAVAGAAAAYWALTSRRSHVARERLSDYGHRRDVDSMAEDSFPASDPPSFTPTTGEKKATAG